MTIAMDSTSQSVSSRSFHYLDRWKRTVQFLSASLIILFVLAVSFQICAMTINGKNSQIGTGLWCGIVYGGTAALALLAIRRNDKAMTIGLMSTATVSVFTSVALITLAAISVSSPFQGENNTLWMTSNWILVTVGFLGFLASITLAIITGRSILCKEPKNDRPIPMEEPREMNSNPPPQSSLAPSPSNAFLETIAEENVDQTIISLAGSGIYESIESRKDSGIESAQQYVEKESVDNQHVPMVEPIYATLVKKREATSTSTTGDFDIEIDDGTHTTDDKAAHKTTWFEVDQSQDPIGSDVDDTEFTRNIELPKEDVIIHAPPSDILPTVL